MLGSNGTITGGLVASGSALTSMTESATDTSTYSEAGGRTVSDGLDYLGGTYTDTETTTESDSEFDSTSLGLGLSGTISGGTDSFTNTDSYSDSQSDTQDGAEVVYDPAGFPRRSQRHTLAGCPNSCYTKDIADRAGVRHGDRPGSL